MRRTILPSRGRKRRAASGFRGLSPALSHHFVDGRSLAMQQLYNGIFSYPITHRASHLASPSPSSSALHPRPRLLPPPPSSVWHFSPLIFVHSIPDKVLPLSSFLRRNPSTQLGGEDIRLPLRRGRRRAADIGERGVAKGVDGVEERGGCCRARTLRLREE